jgi:hypothetical protein
MVAEPEEDKEESSSKTTSDGDQLKAGVAGSFFLEPAGDDLRVFVLSLERRSF